MSDFVNVYYSQLVNWLIKLVDTNKINVMQNEIIHLMKLLVQLQEHMLDCMRGKVQPTDQQEWLDATDVKQLLHISSSTLYRLVKTNKVAFKQIGGKRYYLKAALFKPE